MHSHQGLTYGGLVLQQKSKFQEVIGMMKTILQFLQNQHIVSLQLKQLPTIYCDFPSDEMEYLSFILNAKLVRRDSLSVINLPGFLLLAFSILIIINLETPTRLATSELEVPVLFIYLFISLKEDTST